MRCSIRVLYYVDSLIIGSIGADIRQFGAIGYELFQYYPLRQSSFILVIKNAMQVPQLPLLPLLVLYTIV